MRVMMSGARSCLRLGAVVVAISVSSTVCAQGSIADTQAEVATVLYASAAKLVAQEKQSDDALHRQQAAIEALRSQVAAGARERRAELAAAEQAYVAKADALHRDVAVQIAILRDSVVKVTSTPEGAAALARFNAGDEAGAVGVVHALAEAQVKMLQTKSAIESAAALRPAAQLAYQAWSDHKLSAQEVIAELEEVTNLDPGVFGDWLDLATVYQSASRPADAQTAAQRAVSLATSDLEREASLGHLGDVLASMNDRDGAKRAYRDELAVISAIAVDSANDDAVLGSLDRLGWKLESVGDLADARTAVNASARIAVRFLGPGVSAESSLTDGAVVAGRNILQMILSDQIAIAQEQGDNAGALAAAEQALSIARQSFASVPMMPFGMILAMDLADAEGRVGDIKVKLGDAAGARAAYLEEMGTRRTKVPIAWPPPSFDEAQPLFVRGDWLLTQGDPSDAKAYFDLCLPTFRNLVRQHPGNAAAAAVLAVELELEGDAAVALHDQVGAIAALNEALGLLRGLPGQDDAVVTVMAKLAVLPGSGVRWSDVASQLQIMATHAPLTATDSALLTEAQSRQR